MGGLLDDVLTVTTNLFLVIPTLIVLILLSGSLEEGRSLTLIALIIGCTTWTWSARAVRAQSSSLRSRDHVALARINGASNFQIVTLHILPYLLSYIFMVFILQTANGILTEASISMLGLGPYDSVSLGTNWMTTLSVMTRTASLSTSGTLRPTGRASPVRAVATMAPTMAEINPAPPARSEVNEAGSVTQLQGPNSMMRSIQERVESVSNPPRSPSKSPRCAGRAAAPGCRNPPARRPA